MAGAIQLFASCLFVVGDFGAKATETSDQLSLRIRGVDARLVAIRND
jgi:hypothetical protein